MKDVESEDLVQYISLAQHVVGNVIQYCASFIKEIDRTFKDLPILDYFTNGDTFPQPGSNEIAYAAQRLKGIVRKDLNRPFSNGTQMEVFWIIKSFLEKAVQNSREQDFVEFCVLAMCEGDESLGDHVGLLRTFVMKDIFCEYFRIAREGPEVGNQSWGYILPVSMVLREIYAYVWESMLRDNIVGLKAFINDLLRLSVAMYGLVEVIAGQDGELYSVICARTYDFIIFVEHVAFYTKDIIELEGMVTSGYSDIRSNHTRANAEVIPVYCKKRGDYTRRERLGSKFDCGDVSRKYVYERHSATRNAKFTVRNREHPECEIAGDHARSDG
jgi:hypothetical protein